MGFRALIFATFVSTIFCFAETGFPRDLAQLVRGSKMEIPGYIFFQ